jgi:hypothetical protein
MMSSSLASQPLPPVMAGAGISKFELTPMLSALFSKTERDFIPPNVTASSIERIADGFWKSYEEFLALYAEYPPVDRRLVHIMALYPFIGKANGVQVDFLFRHSQGETSLSYSCYTNSPKRMSQDPNRWISHYAAGPLHHMCCSFRKGPNGYFAVLPVDIERRLLLSNQLEVVFTLSSDHRLAQFEIPTGHAKRNLVLSGAFVDMKANPAPSVFKIEFRDGFKLSNKKRKIQEEKAPICAQLFAPKTSLSSSSATTGKDAPGPIPAQAACPFSAFPNAPSWPLGEVAHGASDSTLFNEPSYGLAVDQRNNGQLVESSPDSGAQFLVGFPGADALPPPPQV